MGEERIKDIFPYAEADLLFFKKSLTNVDVFNIIYLFSTIVTERDPRGAVAREAAFWCEPPSAARDRSLPSRKEERRARTPDE